MGDEVIVLRRKEEATKKAIREGGFYGRNGVWNSIITFSGDNKLYRERVETIIIRNGKEVFVKRKPNGEYFLPGGSTERDIPHINQAINECHEEAHIEVQNIQSTGITYKERHETPAWAKKDSDVEWQGSYTEIYVAEYAGKFTGHIDDEDQDPFIESGRWYSTKECFKWFKKEHREALLWYIKSINEKEENFTESYISNYFKNKKFLKKISRKPDIEKGAVEQIVSTLKKEYGKLSAKSKIQRERRSPDVKEIFHPIIVMDFDDGCSICIAICFDDHEFSDGCAFNSSEYGNVVVVYPCFFKANKENQVFTLLHEIGHVRLQHIDIANSKCDIFGNDKTAEYRISTMRKGKAMYPEVNADLYAVLNGASMYSILNSTVNKDYDKDYDYRFTNSELASRYHQVFKRYGNLKGYALESDVSRYDIACIAIYEMVYQNESIDFLSDELKDQLYSILYEYGINRKIKDDEDLKLLTEKYEEQLSIYNKKVKSYEESVSKTLDITEFKEGSNDNFKNDFSLAIDDADDDFITNEIAFYKEKVENLYFDVLEKKTDLFESKCERININTKSGNNPKAAYVSEAKKIFENELIDILEDMQDKLEIKKESDETGNASRYLYIIESLTKAERDKIPLDKFGIEETRSYPLDSKKHTKSAIALFYKAPDEFKKQLAHKIIDAMEIYKISLDSIGEKNELRKYI